MLYKEYKKDIAGAKGAVLFIHGFLGSTKHFEKFIPLIPNDYAVHNLMLSGHGGSVRDFSKTCMQNWKDEADRAAAELIKKYKNIVIAAHSMGTFFAMDAAVKYPDNVRAVFLLQTPLKIGVKATAFKNSIRSVFGFAGNDETALAYKNSHSIELTARVWEYAGWIPRYLELFAEARRARNTIREVGTDMHIFQSAKDELVSMRSLRFIPERDNISLNVLKNSAHFIYSEEDFSFMLDEFCKLFCN